MAEKKRGPGRPPGSKNKNTNNSKGKKSSSAGKNQNGDSAASKRVRELEAKDDARAIIKDEIIGFIIVALGVFLVVALQTEYAGSAGSAISNGLKGMFGFTAFVLPYYFIVYGILLFARKTIHMGIKSILLLVIIFLMIALINAGRFMHPIVEGGGFMGVTESIEDGISLDGGGLFGMSVADLLVGWIGIPGLYILTFVVIFICLLLLINTPVSRFFENLQNAKKRRALEKHVAITLQEEEVEAARRERARIKAEEEARALEEGRRPDRIISLMNDDEPKEVKPGKRVRKKRPLAETK